jgi:hypothetical protein
MLLTLAATGAALAAGPLLARVPGLLAPPWAASAARAPAAPARPYGPAPR